MQLLLDFYLSHFVLLLLGIKYPEHHVCIQVQFLPCNMLNVRTPLLSSQPLYEVVIGLFPKGNHLIEV